MAKTSTKDRLSPPLMYAFRSAHEQRLFAKDKPLSADPDSVGDRPTGRAVAQRVSLRSPITEQALRQDVARDLGNLVNTINLASAVELEGFDSVRRSILNFGIRDTNSRYADMSNDGSLVRDVETAIRVFEPRLISDSVRINRVVRVDEPSLTVRLEITADLFCEPINVPVVFMADVDVDNLAIDITRAA